MSMVEHMVEPSRVVCRLEVITGVGGRRRWSEAEKRRITAEAMVPGAVVSEIARRHGMSPAASVHLAAERRRAAGTQGAEAPCLCRRWWTALPEPSVGPRSVKTRRPRRRRRTGSIGDRWCRGPCRVRRKPEGDRGGDQGPEGGIVIGPTGAVRVMVATRRGLKTALTENLYATDDINSSPLIEAARAATYQASAICRLQISEALNSVWTLVPSSLSSRHDSNDFENVSVS